MDRLQKIVREADLPNYGAPKRTQLAAMIKAGEFPRPIRLSTRRKGWLESEVLAWQQARIAARDGAEQ